MSDIVNPHIDSYYLHPKKYAWRADSKIVNPEQSLPAPEGGNISSVIQERFKMVISSNFKIQNGIGDQQSAIEKYMSQDAPLDFSVKAVINSDHDNCTNLKQTHSDLSTPRDSNMSPDGSEMHSIFSKSTSDPVFAYNGKVSSSTVPIYNGSSKYQRPKQRHLNNSSPISHVDTQSPTSYAKLEIDRPSQIPTQDQTRMQNISTQNTNFEGSSHHRQEHLLNRSENSSFIRSGQDSPRHSPKLSRESTPEHSRYKGSILHEVLARTPEERATNLGSYLQKPHPSAATTKSEQGLVTPPFLGVNYSIPPATLMTADAGSMLPSTSTLIQRSNPLMPAGFAFINRLGFSPTALNGMNPFVNGSLLSPTQDSRMSQTQNSSDRKLSKPIRPFKAITNELLYGIPTMGLPTMNPVIHNGGYFRGYKEASNKDSVDLPKSSPLPKRESPETSANSAINSSPPCSFNNGTDHKMDVAGSGDSNCSFADGSGSVVLSAESTSNNRKRSRSLHDNLKDEAYWERRRKNNQAAKRSRDARRQKEDMVAQQAWMLREQNVQLGYQITSIEEQYRILQIQFHSITEQSHNLELQLRITKEKLARNRCVKCGSRIEEDVAEANYAESNKNI